MHIKVLLFAHLADATGKRELELELPDGATVGEAMDQLAQQYEAIAKMRAVVAVAVDETYVRDEVVLAKECTMALIPPVSGG